MVFSSTVFIFLFLPAVLGIYLALGRALAAVWALRWLVGASLFFYGWWDWRFLPLLLVLLVLNYGLGETLHTARGVMLRRSVLIGALVLNLGVLGWFKYAGFFANVVEDAGGPALGLAGIILPLGISFFTFQKIAYLVDVYRGGVRRYSPTEFALFVTFFPQLIAGPIVHHNELLPGFRRPGVARLDWVRLSTGLTIFFIGVFKKLGIADPLALHANPVFDAAARGEVLDAWTAWRGAVAYTFQIYFDFSGYSDMAIGLARMFGVRLPLNFNSPYRATSIIDFWRRWHMTLSRFLRDHLYIPLGGNRQGKVRRYGNLLLTMILGGLWHGAGWTFIAWGLLHGLYLIANHGWRALRGAGTTGPVERAAGWALTFLAVVAAWVFFRATSFDAALAVLAGMAGVNGLGQAVGRDALALVALLAFVVWMPNTNELLRRYRPSLTLAQRPPLPLAWRPTWPWVAFTVAVALYALYRLGGQSEFIYFNF